MKTLQQFDEWLAIMEKAAVVLIFSLLVLMTLFNILSRNLFQVSFQGILEFSPALILWVTLMGSSLALKENRHIKIEVLLRFVSKRFRYYARILTSVFGMVITGVLFYASLEFVASEISIFHWKGLFTLVFPWFFLAAFFRFFLKAFSLENKPS
ncbi:MAG: TRAP transporter small permease subunit [Proteobacteria bacterium]|nr:TRAP transporter small permease subunit [Pseudomonadota bacterium]MBU4469820.1 TRAP transporter small permease subunit [Pseudomonadota bacterium]MCG2753055.1 TRAP transporter small permease subunit [Desulfobacteraceae bacterium]